MDQVTKIYNEMVAYDPSMAQHKEKIFSLIHTMVEAKPTFSFDPQRKEQLDSRIADHIARASATAKPFSYARMAKRGVSVASFWIIGIVAAASMVYLKIEHTQQQKVKRAGQNLQLSSTGAEEVALHDTSVADSSAADQTALSHDSVSYSTTAPESTTAKAAVTSSIAQNETVAGAASVNAEVALPPEVAADPVSALSLPAAVRQKEVSQQQKISIVFVGETTQNISSILGVPTTFVGTETELKSALVFTAKVNVMRPLDEKIRDGKKIVDELEKSLGEKNVIVLHMDYPTSIEVAQALIAELQAKGYVFVTVSELND